MRQRAAPALGAALALLAMAPAAAAHTHATLEPGYCGPGGDTHLHTWVHPYGLHAHVVASARVLGGAVPVEACVAAGLDLDPPVPIPGA